MWNTLIASLHEPRLVTGATISAYAVLLVLGFEVLFQLPKYHLIYWVPAFMMIVGALVGLPCAWLGGRQWARWELVFMPISIAGLSGGILIEATAIWSISFAGHVLIYLGLLVLIVVVARWVYIRRTYDL